LAAVTTLERGPRTRLSREERSEEILGAARRVFAEKGFTGTTIADIAEEAKIALGTIYLYFPSKESVFAALHQQLAEIIAQAIGGAMPATSIEDAVRTRVGRVFAACAENRDLVRLLVLNTDPGSETTKRMRLANRERYTPLVETIAAAIKIGAVRAADPTVIVRLIHGLVSFAVYDTFVLSDGEDAEQYQEACADMLIAYLKPTT
jgi:AcrR family transcriptional regulator